MEIKLFGSFRKYGNGEFIEIAINDTITIARLKELFIKKIIEIEGSFNEEAIVDASAFAVNDEIVADNYQIKNNDILAILPPVCGG